jgi:hypothetical protein
MVAITAQTTTSRCLTTSTYSDTNRLETTSGGGASTTQMSRDRYGLQPDKLVSIEHLLGEDAEHTRELQALAKEARQYITSFGWCRHVKATYAGIVIPGVVGVFLFHIEPSGEDVDDWIWVIVGDLPPAYIAPQAAKTPAEAVEAYIAEMQAWVETVRQGRSVDGLIPVNVPPEPRFAEALAKRLRLLREEVLDKHVGDLRS